MPLVVDVLGISRDAQIGMMGGDHVGGFVVFWILCHDVRHSGIII
jgi:hypothetical protein